MNSFNNTGYYNQMNEVFQPMNTHTHYHEYSLSSSSSDSSHKCLICGSKAIGLNFGVLTCAPCKAFFRRNARRKEILELVCRHRDFSAFLKNPINFTERNMRYLQIRRCASCRLRRCFDVGMKEELIRTDEENEQYRQLVDINRKRREFLKQRLQEIEQISISQYIFNDKQLADEIDWCHLSNIVYAYDTHCLNTYIQQRSTLVFNESSSILDEQSVKKYPTNFTTSVVLGISSFFQSLPAFYSLPYATQKYLSENNIRPLIFPNIHELNQSCFSESWQVEAQNATWEFMCGSALYELFSQAENLAKNTWITDPIVIRLLFILLFFSTPLHYHDECPKSTPILKKKSAVYEVQNAYVTLLWKYLLYRHGDREAVRIYTNLIHVYMKMQYVGFGIYTRLRTQQDLIRTNETIDELITLDVNDDDE